jgi:hypothetical protein
MSDQTIFSILGLFARPAAGKSEVIDYLKHTPLEERIKRFHVGEVEEIDDFPMLWTWFEEDMLLEKMGHPRLHTDKDGYFLHRYLWDLLIERIGLEYRKKMRDNPDINHRRTTLIEFSRGKEHGGYRSAFSHLSSDICEKLAVLYLDVSWEESLRKNRRRFNPDKPDSILEHALPDEKLARLYRDVDWEEVSGDDPNYLTINHQSVPYVVFDNADDVTTPRGNALGERLESCLSHLWKNYMSVNMKK